MGLIRLGFSFMYKYVFNREITMLILIKRVHFKLKDKACFRTRFYIPCLFDRNICMYRDPDANNCVDRFRLSSHIIYFLNKKILVYTTTLYLDKNARPLEHCVIN